ncbi:MAG TPA: hypothetical protein VGF50_11370, partial [Caulobacteraceae bacterium]
MSSLTQDSALEAAPAAAIGKPRPLFWSVRRELWENRSIVVAPLATAAVVLFGLVLGAINLPQQVVIEGSLKMDAAQRANAAQIPFDVAAAVVMVAAFVTGFFYCLGALYGERRDRSILFWKSLPVSDLTTVAAKATVVLAILPIVTFLVVIATHVVLLAASIPLLAMHGLPTMLFWQQFPLVRTWAVL